MRLPVDSYIKQELASLYKYMSKRLDIKEIPKIIFTQNKKNSKILFGLTAHYDPTKKTIKVYITDRHPIDILKSFAHELIHHWQNERGTLTPQNGGHEHYAQNDINLRKREYEAFLLSSVLVRDWQDENRYGPPKTPPPLPPPYD